jgi:hypothetical protein
MTWPVPDIGTAERMRSATAEARTQLQLVLTGEHVEAWGWRGRTYSQPVRTSTGLDVWLRVASVRCATAERCGWDPTFWVGAVCAQQDLPPRIPRPALRCWYDWESASWRYRVEVYERICEGSLGEGMVLNSKPVLSSAWWVALRDASEALAGTTTRRHTIHQAYLGWVMPRFLGEPIDVQVPAWSTSHGDLNWANLCAPTLMILDWEGWGLAPEGYDAATLHTYSLLVPEVAAQIRVTFEHALNGPNGRFAELAAIAELLHAVSRGELSGLAAPMRHRAASLLGRDVP